MPFGLRQLAATVLKKLVREHWTGESPHYKGPQVGAEEKEAIREALPTGLGDESSKVRTAVAMAVAAIARWDCPQQWPGLIPGLVQAITAKKNANMGGLAGRGPAGVCAQASHGCIPRRCFAQWDQQRPIDAAAARHACILACRRLCVTPLCTRHAWARPPACSQRLGALPGHVCGRAGR